MTYDDARLLSVQLRRIANAIISGQYTSKTGFLPNLVEDNLNKALAPCGLTIAKLGRVASRADCVKDLGGPHLGGA